MWLRSFELTFVELAESTTQVRFQILRSFVGYFDRVLKNGFRNDFHVWKAWWLRWDEASELRVSTAFKGNFKVTFELLHPALHEMHILEHNPVSFLGSLCEYCVCSFLLTLTHGDIGKCSVFYLLVVCETNLFDIRSWINTREQNEEGWSTWLGFFV